MLLRSSGAGPVLLAVVLGSGAVRRRVLVHIVVSLSGRMTHTPLAVQLREGRGHFFWQVLLAQKNADYQEADHRLRPLDAAPVSTAPVSIGAPKTVMGKIQVQVALRDAPKPPPPRFEDRPFAFGRVAVSAFLTDVFFAVLYASMLIDFAQKPVASPRVRVHLTALFYVRKRSYVRKRRGKEALLACVASKFEEKSEDAPSAVSLYSRYHQRTISSVSAPPTFRQPPCAGRTAAFLLAYISPLLPAFDVHIVCFEFREPLFALGQNFALGVKGLSDRLSHPSRSFSRHANFFSNRPCSSALVHLLREVDPASQAYVGGFQKRARRVDKPLAAGNHLPQASQ